MKRTRGSTTLLVLNSHQFARKFLQLQCSQFHQTLGLYELRDPCPEFFVQLPRSFFEVSSFRQISGDFCEPSQRPTLISQSSDDDVCPKRRTIFSHTQPFVRIPSFFSRNFQFTVRPFAFCRLPWVKAGEMLPDNFRGTVALNSLCTLVPRHYLPTRIEQKNSVVLDRVNE